MACYSSDEVHFYLSYAGEAETVGRALQPLPEVQPLSRLLAAVDVARVRAKQPIEWCVRVQEQQQQQGEEGGGG